MQSASFSHARSSILACERSSGGGSNSVAGIHARPIHSVGMSPSSHRNQIVQEPTSVMFATEPASHATHNTLLKPSCASQATAPGLGGPGEFTGHPVPHVILP